MNELAVPQLFMDIYERMPRQGPGNEDSTLKALAALGQLPEEPNILDLGCGSGAQTVQLAQATGSHVTAVDFYEPFLRSLRSNADEAGVGDRVQTVLGDMATLDFEDESFDLIWSEGAIYLMGFENGLKAWRRLLKSAARMAVTEATWLTDSPPDPCKAYWDREYPALTSVAANIETIEASGYTHVANFPLPASAWLDDYYAPLRRVLAEFRTTQGANADDMAIIDMCQTEIDMYDQYGDAYGYVFYLMEKTE